MKEEVNQFVIDVNGASAIFEKENDASILRTNSPGKLIKYFLFLNENDKETKE